MNTPLIKKLKLDPRTVIITKEKLEKSRQQYAMRSFSLQKPPQVIYNRAEVQQTKKIHRVPSPLQKNTVFGSLLYQQQSLFKGSNVVFSRKLAKRQTEVDKDAIQKFGTQALIMENYRPSLHDLDELKLKKCTNQHFQKASGEDDQLVLFKNQFYEIRQKWPIFTQNIYQNCNIVESYRFLLDMCKMFRYMRQKLVHSEYQKFLTSIIDINDLRLLLLGLIQSSMNSSSVAVNTGLIILYFLLDLDIRIKDLKFFKEALRSFAINFLQKLISIVDNDRIGQIISLIMWKLVALNIISFKESSMLYYPHLYTNNRLPTLVKAQHRYKINKQIFQQQTGLIFSSNFSSPNLQNLQRYTLNIYSDASQVSNCYLVAFKSPPNINVNSQTKDYARAIANMLQLQGVKARKTFSRSNISSSVQILKKDLQHCFNQIDFESFQQRFSLFSNMTDEPILTQPDSSPIVILSIDRPVVQITFDTYQRSAPIVFSLISAGPQKQFTITDIYINQWTALDKLPPVQFLAPAVIYRQKAAERASLRLNNNIQTILRVQFAKKQTKFEEDLIEALADTKKNRMTEKYIVNDFFDLVQDQDLLFGNYLESVHMLQQLEEIGLDIVNFKFPTVSQASQQIYDKMCDEIMVDQNYQVGTIGLLVEQMYTEITIQQLKKAKALEEEVQEYSSSDDWALNDPVGKSSQLEQLQ
ncbi:hypothetical protein SS50377_27696 [Spironucleus salmonicida]|uniref:Uncharacterized protein n=1 Tax=Spironucleus salmonicida TaxID=348837 RepID=V6LQK3_9EUKA|nr:hypothetical protein SS50377_27696 [Spironucleus salmonicida]|eukprot:EST46528.1 Hypothetical protein SS50377_13333 [Spironucleus salmonicida]